MEDESPKLCEWNAYFEKEDKFSCLPDYVDTFTSVVLFFSQFAF